MIQKQPNAVAAEHDNHNGAQHDQNATGGGEKFDTVMTDEQMADELGVPLASLRFWWSVGKGPPSFKAGRYRRGLRSTFLQWCREQQGQ